MTATATHPTVRDDIPAGDPNLTHWPPSMVEIQLAREVLGTTGDLVALIEVTGSANRALAVLDRARHEHHLTVLAHRAFGQEPE